MVNKKIFLIFLLALSSPALATNLSDSYLYDYQAHGITSQASGGQRALDIGINVSGTQVDPRARTWTLLNTTDSVNAVQSGTWTISVGNFPSSFSISNFPSTQAVTGTFWQATQPVSGTFWQTTQPVSAASLPLPTGAATSALQSTANASLSSIDSKLTSPISVTGTVTGTNSANGNTGSAVPTQATQVAGSDGTSLRALKVSSGGVLSIDGSATIQPVSGTFWQATQPVSGSLGRSWTLLNSTDSVNAVQSGTWNLTNISGTISLPTGAATSSLQTTGNTSLSSIDGKTPALGQALSAASVPVVLPAAQITTLTPPTSVTVTQATGSNLHTAVDSLPAIPTGANTIGAVNQAGTWNITNVSGTVSLPTGAATAAKQPAIGTAGSASVDVLSVQGVAGGTALPVSGTFFQATQPVSAASLPLPTGASTSANQSTMISSLANIPAQGLANVTGSEPVSLPKATTVTTSAFTSGTGVLNTDMLTGSLSGWYDAAGYTSFFADIYTTTTVTGGVITFEQTNDTTNDAAGITMNLQDSTVLTQTNVTSLTLAASTIKHYQAPITARYVRFRISTAFAGTGTVGATVNFRQTPYNPMVYGIAQATAGSLNATIGSGTITTVSTVTNLTTLGTITNAVPTKAPILVNSTLSARQTVTTTESTLAAPANSVGVMVECESVNADSLRWGFSNSGTAILSSTLGMLCEPGRDSGFLPLGAGNTLHLISLGAGSDFADVQWVLSQ